jgi:hypothetical protein
MAPSGGAAHVRVGHAEGGGNMGARAAIVWVVTIAVAFGLGWWVGKPPTLDAADMASSLERALEEKDPLARTRLMVRVFETLDAANVEEVMEIIEAEPRIEESEISLLMYVWTQVDPQRAFEAARRSKHNLIRDEGTAAATYYWALDNPKAALYWVETIEDKTFREYLTEYLITGWVLSGERDSAAIYIARLPRGVLKQLQTSLIMNEYLKEGPEEAIRWAELLPEDVPREYRHEVFQRVSKQVASRDPELAAQWITEHLGQDHARNTLRLIAAEWHEQDPQATVEWLVSLPDGRQRNRVLYNSFGRWFDDDPRAAQRWLEAEAIRAAHDPVLDAFARRLSEKSPRQALHWAQMIEEPVRREKSLIVVGQNWVRKNPEAARAWLETSELSEDARRAALKPPPREAEATENEPQENAPDADS